MWQGFDGYYETDLACTSVVSSEGYKVIYEGREFFYVDELDEDYIHRYHFYWEDRESGNVTAALSDVRSFRLDDFNDPKGLYYNIYGDLKTLRYYDFAAGTEEIICTLPQDCTMAMLFETSTVEKETADYFTVYGNIDYHEQGNESMIFIHKHTGDYFVLDVSENKK